jgi:two-component system, NarL family, sensor histidine kinase UhpB
MTPAENPAPSEPRRPSIARQALISSSALLALIFALLIVTPVTVSAPIQAGEVVILGLAFIAVLVLNVIRIRRAFAPLRSFAAEMAAVDLRHPERARIGGSNETVELAAFTDAFNAMLERLADERRAGSRAALVAQERERLRIARALHDEAGQTLTAVALEIERAASEGPESQRRRMAELAAELQSTLDEIRRISRELRPEALDDLGLTNALIALSTRAARQGELQVERRFAKDLPSLPTELELVIYRVAQEALTNVLRHAGASRCVIELRRVDGAVDLSVSDDGGGMPERVARDAVGIEGMRERALLVGGSLAIESGTGRGTTVSLRVPLEPG